MLDHVVIVIPDLDENVTWLPDFNQQLGLIAPHVLDQYHHPETFEISIIAQHNVTAASRKKAISALAFWHLDLKLCRKPIRCDFFYSTQLRS